MSYSRCRYPDKPSQALNRFWEQGIGVTELGTLAFHGLVLAPDSDLIEANDYDLDRATTGFNQMLFARTIDNFQVYIVELLSEIFELRPETVPKGNVTYRELFSAASIGELRKIAVERTVTTYGYMNIVDLSDEIKKSLNFDFF